MDTLTNRQLNRATLARQMLLERSDTGIADLVTIYDCGASVFGKTPKFRAVVRRAKVPKSEVISIGDETRDIEAAAKAGIASGAVTWGYARPEILAEHKPTILFNAMSEILPAVAG